MVFLKDAKMFVKEGVPECRDFGIKTKMSVGILANVLASLKSNY